MNITTPTHNTAMSSGRSRTESVTTPTNFDNELRDGASTEVEGALGVWGASDKGDLATVRRLLDQGMDVNTRNCLGCVPLMYAAGSGHTEVVSLLLSQPGVCVNIRNNDRLTCFMLAMQVRLVLKL